MPAYTPKYRIGDYKYFKGQGTLKLMGRFGSYDQAEGYSANISNSLVKGTYRPSIKKTTYEVWGTEHI